MTWCCSKCKKETENERCPQCGLPMVEGNPSTATKLLQNSISSPTFMLGTICFTVAVILVILLGILQYNAFTQESFTEAYHAVVNSISYNAPEGLEAQANSFVQKNIYGEASLPTLAILAAVGIWLLVVEGNKRQFKVKKGGFVCLKVYFVIQIVLCALSILTCILGFLGILLFRNDLLNMLQRIPDEYTAISIVLGDILQAKWFIPVVAIVLGGLTVISVLFLVYSIEMTKSIYRVKYVAETGNLAQKKVSLFAIILMFIGCAISLVYGFFTLIFDKNLEGLYSILYGISYCMFALTLIEYRKSVKRVCDSGMDEAKIPMTNPVNPTEKPVASMPKPVAPIAKPVASMQNPVASIANPASSTQKPVAPMAKPVVPMQKPEAPMAKPVAPMTKPVAPMAKPVAPKQEAVSPAIQRGAIFEQQSEISTKSNVPQNTNKEFEQFLERQEVKVDQSSTPKVDSTTRKCPRCGQSLKNPYFCTNCGLRL